jgi:hypothetical protein
MASLQAKFPSARAADTWGQFDESISAAIYGKIKNGELYQNLPTFDLVAAIKPIIMPECKMMFLSSAFLSEILSQIPGIKI